MSRNIELKLNNGESMVLTEEEFNNLNFSEILKDNTNQWIDLGPRGFQKYNLVSWDYEKVKVEGPIQ